MTDDPTNPYPAPDTPPEGPGTRPDTPSTPPPPTPPSSGDQPWSAWSGAGAAAASDPDNTVDNTDVGGTWSATDGDPTVAAGPPVTEPPTGDTMVGSAVDNAVAGYGGSGTPPVAPTPSDVPTGGGGGFKKFLAGSVVGAVVGALVAGGLVYLNDDDAGVSAASSSSTPAQNTAFEEGDQLDIQDVLTRVKPAVVTVRSTIGDTGNGSGGEGEGSGFIVSEDGIIVTNAHVVAGADTVEIDFDDGETREASVVGTDTDNDLAVLDVDATGLPVVELGNSDALTVGDEVVAIGNALGLEGEPTVTTGIVSAVGRAIDTGDGAALESTIQTDAAINRGNSGGPLLNSQGQVVGINTAIADPSFAQGVGFAIAIEQAKPVIETLRKGTFLGVNTLSVTEEVAASENLSVDAGALVAQVEDGSPADQAGVQEGDVILEVDGTAIERNVDVATAVRAREPGDEIEIVVDRGGDTVTLSAVLGTRAG